MAMNPESTRVGWIRIGVMGVSTAGHVLEAGYSVTLTTRSPKVMRVSTPGLALAHQIYSTQASLVLALAKPTDLESSRSVSS